MLYITLLSSLIVFTIFSGIYFSRNPSKVKKLARRFLTGNVVAFVVLLLIVFLSMPSSQLYAAQNSENAIDGNNNTDLGFIGIALSKGLAAIGAGIAVGMVGTASVGAISEKPELFGRTLIYVGLAEGIAIYGLIMGIMMLGRM